jgi:hypothetical protein
MGGAGEIFAAPVRSYFTLVHEGDIEKFEGGAVFVMLGASGLGLEMDYDGLDGRTLEIH